MQPVSRLLMLCVLVAAPWCLAGAPMAFQPWLFGGILLAVIAGIFCDVSTRSCRTFYWTALAFPMLGTALLGLAGVQLLAASAAPSLPHAVLSSSLQVLNGSNGLLGPGSLYPAETRLAMARLALAISAFVGGAWLFSSNSSRNWLWTVLATNGAALVVFGLIQKASGTDRIFWTIPLRFGGQPFASFVNRNNAAGYLAMCLAVSLGLMLRDRSQGAFSPRRDSERDSFVPDGHELQGLSGRRQFLLAIIVVICAGILATLSRGGILSAMAAFLVALVWLGGFRRWRFLVIPLGGTLLIAVGLIAWIGFGGQLHYRLASLTHPFSEDGRAAHWADMLNAVRDFPILGTGLGTYRYANKPYQDHFSHGWYVNADNQYLEWLVEAGVPGLLIALAGLATLACLCRNWHRSGGSSEAIVCGFLLITQGLQSLTDFGVIVTANLLTLAVLLGSLSASDIRDRTTPLSPTERLQRALDQHRSQLRALGVALLVIVVAGLGWAELVTAAASASYRNQLPITLDKREDLTLPETDAALTRGNWILSLRPDDAELHALMARLWFHRYRLETFAAMSRQTSVPPRNTEYDWTRTDLDALFSEVSRLNSIGATDTLDELGRDSIAIMNLEPTWHHLKLARKACPILPKLGFLESTVGILKGKEDGHETLRREATLSPSDPLTLRRIGLFADRLGDRELFMICLQRQLQFNTADVDDLFSLATTRFDTPEIVAKVLPQNPESLVRIAEVWKSTEGRCETISKAKLSLQGTRLPLGQQSYLAARLAILDVEPNRARIAFIQAIRANPLEVPWRLRYAEFLEEQGELAAALEQAELCRALVPSQASIRERVVKLKLLQSDRSAK